MRRTALLAVLGVVVVLIVGAVVVVTRDEGTETDPDEAAAAAALASFADGLAARDLSGAPVAADTSGDPTGEMAAMTEGLGDATLTVTPGRPSVGGDDATATLTLDWVVGDVEWSVATTVALTRAPEGPWQVVWDPTVLHPDLRAGDRLVAERLAPERAAILGGDGAVLVEERDVVVVGVEPQRVADVSALTAELEAALGIDGAALAGRIAAAAPDAFVEVITLRSEDYEAVRDRIYPLPGTVFREDRLPLAPSRTFARALLGTAGPVTAEVIEASGGRYEAGDVAGLSGLQERYDEQLAGTNGLRVVIERGDPTPESGSSTTTTRSPTPTTVAPLEVGPVEVFRADPVAGEPVVTTIDPVVQQAADDVLADVDLPSALVVVRPSTGEVLAVANGPAQGTNLALEGTYPPGSSFKVISAYAALEGGLGVDDPVACPATATVDGREFSNAEDEVLGTVPFRTAFALSCNTAFVGLAEDFEPSTLTDAAAVFGLGGDWEIGVPAATGSVPVAESDVDLAASAFGQGRILVSPLDMAMVAATVADGSWRPPQLVVGAAPTPGAAEPLPPTTTDALRTLMRAVVTEGTGSAVAAVAGGPVSGKTGTAEFGDDDPPRSHAWFIGFQGDLAFAAFVEGGEFGGETAAPLAAELLTALAG